MGHLQPLKNDLKRQQKYHTMKKSFQCTDCNKTFSSKITFLLHTRIHVERKPQLCSDRMKPFNYAGSQQRLEEDQSTYTCNHCYKSFARKGSLTLHMKIHMQARLYQCIKCDQSFVERAELLKHQESHICKKAIQCKKCNRHFLLKDNLKKHMVVHAKKKPCICSHCGLHFKNMIDLVNHEKKVMGIMTGVFSK